MQFVYDTLAGQGVAGTLLKLLISSGVVYCLAKAIGVIGWLEMLRKNGIVNDAITRTQVVVTAVNQAYTDDLKASRADGKLTDEEKKHAFDMAKEMLISQSWGEGVDFVKDNADSLIEATIGLMKGEKDVPLASPQPLPDSSSPQGQEVSSSVSEVPPPLPEVF